MFFLNLSGLEVLALFSAVSAVVVTLYLLDRSRRRQTVATLRFWVSAQQPKAVKHRRRIQQPWSLLLQLVSLLLLILALAQLRWGAREVTTRDHVLLLDTSAGMAAQPMRSPLMPKAQEQVAAYLRALPSPDRVMLVRVDGLATPATGFEPDREKLFEAVRASRPGATPLNLAQGLEFAEQALRQNAREAGEIVYVGPGRYAADSEEKPPAPAGLRALLLSSNLRNAGLRRVGLRRSAQDAEVWEIYVSVHNDGAAAANIPVSVRFGGAEVGGRLIPTPPGASRDVNFTFRTRAAGLLDVSIPQVDDFPADNHAVLELPQQTMLALTVYSDEPELLRPIFASNSLVKAEYLRIAQYKPDSGARLVVLDRFVPAVLPKVSTILIDPPASKAPIPVRAAAHNVTLARWRSDHPLGAGLHSREVKLESVNLLSPAAKDVSIAETEGGSIIAARPGDPKLVEFGFHPVRSGLRYELATPLLFANILRWMEPGPFRQAELFAESPGSLETTLDEETDPGQLKVVAERQGAIPFTVHDRKLRFFSNAAGTVRVQSKGREWVYSLTVPSLGDRIWQVPTTARRGVPATLLEPPRASDLWQWLAAFGALGLLAEWMLYGRSRGLVAVLRQPASKMPWRQRRAS